MGWGCRAVKLSHLCWAACCLPCTSLAHLCLPPPLPPCPFPRTAPNCSHSHSRTTSGSSIPPGAPLPYTYGQACTRAGHGLWAPTLALALAMAPAPLAGAPA